AAFTGTDANGDWLLYIVDDTSLNIGFVANGWSISILTSQAILPAADLSVNLSALPDPVDTSTPFTYTSAVTNHGPDIATNMTLIDSIPLPNTLLRLVTILPPGQGTYEVRATNGVSQVIGHLGSLANGGWAIMSVQVMAPATNSQLVAVATVSGSQMDLNQGDNTSTVTNTVADLPRLKIRIEAGNLVIVWPVSSGNYYLQSTPVLNPAVWTNVPQTPVVPPSGPDAGSYKVTIPLSGASQFFRLRAQ
ncbi:MAG: hypothetical protein NTW03_18005, partial [Verrucomicrobia bacterium]|nr:hypothetical protein [Verrucomicrobiota bacterium]